MFSFLKSEQIITGDEALHYGGDWTKQFQIKPSGVLFPKTTQEVSDIVKEAYLNDIKLVPSGGRTGLSGGAVASHQEWVVSFEKMNQILSYSKSDSTVSVQAGVVTQEIQTFLEPENKYFPVEFGATGSSHIGGNVATNAGGVHVLRYGSTRDWVMGLTVVTGTGEILNLNQGLVKNNTGYDLRHLFIGSEGTLGFITELEIKVCSKPKNKQVILLGIDSLDVILDCYSYARDNLPLHAFEMFTDKALEKVLAAHKSLAKPLDSSPKYYLLLEVEISNGFNEEELSKHLEVFFDNSWASDGTISSNSSQYTELWKYRELISESLAPLIPYKNDVSVKISKIPEFLKIISETVNKNYPQFEVVIFGHIGDGNLHINALKPENMSIEDFSEEGGKVSTILFQKIKELGGSISAEHGVGLLKKPYLTYSKTKYEISLMKEIKRVFDPKNIINPGKIF